MSLNIQVLVGQDSWIVPYCLSLKQALMAKGHQAHLIESKSQIKQGDILVILSWGKLLNKQELSLHKHNIVVHASALPQGKGWSPLTWQILEGKNNIPITLFEAVEKVDSGPIYLQDSLLFKGDELIEEMRKELGNKTVEMVLKFIEAFPNVKGKEQEGDPSFYKRRIPEDSQVSIDRPIKELFNQLRTADNERYPVFFRHKGHKYILKVFKDKT